MLHLAEHGSDLSTVCDMTAVQNHLTPRKRGALPKSKDFSYTGQLGLCNMGKEGPVLLEIKTDIVIRRNTHLAKTVRLFSTFQILLKRKILIKFMESYHDTIVAKLILYAYNVCLCSTKFSSLSSSCKYSGITAFVCTHPLLSRAKSTLE